MGESGRCGAPLKEKKTEGVARSGKKKYSERKVGRNLEGKWKCCNFDVGLRKLTQHRSTHIYYIYECGTSLNPLHVVIPAVTAYYYNKFYRLKHDSFYTPTRTHTILPT